MWYAIRVLLPILMATLSGPSATQAKLFGNVIACVRYMVDFVLLAHYRIYSDESIGLLNHYLDRFHTFKDVFLPYRAGAAAAEALNNAERGGVGLSTEEKNRILAEHSHFNFQNFTFSSTSRSQYAGSVLYTTGRRKLWRACYHL